MKKESRQILSTLLICGLTASVSGVFASDAAALQSYEASIKAFEASGNTKSASFVHQLMGLANAYRANDQRGEAEKTFRKAISIGKEIPNLDIPMTMLGWAMTLTYHPQGQDKAIINADRLHAEEIVNEGLALTEKLPPKSYQRLRYLMGTVRFYKTLENAQKMQERVKILNDSLKNFESDKTLSDLEITQVAATLRELSNLYCPAPDNPLRTARAPMRVSQDENPPSPSVVKRSDFELAETYELRAASILDRLPETDFRRIGAHRNLALWYRFFDQKNQENTQVKILSALLKTSDPAKLFPPIDPCYGCGRG